MSGILISAKPITNDSKPYLLFQSHNGSTDKLELTKDQQIHIAIEDPDNRFCIGWYDIADHTNHPCPNNSNVDQKYESCFVCRSKTNFNPAFYNTANVSSEQLAYNQSSHTVYIAYFGNNIAKAGIMSDSRGLTRLYEQGALLYSIIGSFPNADEARKKEKQLIGFGLKESVRKNQKEVALTSPIDEEIEKQSFSNILEILNLNTNPKIESSLKTYFFGSYQTIPVKKLPEGESISGTIKAVVGRYLILENNNRLYGFWLTDLYGYKLSISSQIIPIKPEPEQVGLF